MKSFILPVGGTLVAGLLSASAHAAVIDFESGFVDLQAVGTASAGSATATFECGAGAPTGDCFIVGYGPPQTSFVPDDMPALAIGDFGLTDETNGPSAELDFFITFDRAVRDLGLDVIDYRVDGGPSIGDTATLTVYSDLAFTNLLDTVVFTIPNPNPVDGNVETLQTSASGIRSAKLVFDKPDVGVAIDNVTFRIPEPTSLALLGLGLLSVGAAGKRSRRT